MKDIFETEIEIGDTVAFNPPNYKGLVSGRVVAFTPKMVQVAWSERTSTTPNTTVVYPENCVVDKADKADALMEKAWKEAAAMKFNEISISPAFEKNHELSYDLDGFVSFDVDSDNYVVILKDEDNIAHVVIGVTHEKNSSTVTIITSNDDVQFSAGIDEELGFTTFKRVTF